ncbi:hypothetical protein JO972_13980 [Verrucomicrobiaceae bacterium 5K15]|uniref:Uncharacterized protein n=1 Tax=Oceaniferula flava TaxID=2800421 RepID=A0AAE2VDH2_9BACT|nr:hypothetical protein [Oceaniferula flavus]MBK1856076.1 hypothetical protein [Oceaniferula flavus]MBM1137383.1 hypothetical protein [Oceaniferula flavus]
MKPWICLSLWLLGNTLGSVSAQQAAAQMSDAEVAAQVGKIRQWYSQIEGAKKLKKTTIKQGEDGGPGEYQLTRYTSADGELKKLHELASGEHGVSNETYYFHNGRLFFVYSAREEWRFTGEKTPSGEDEVIDLASQVRLYFHDGQCIKALEKRIAISGADELRQLLQKTPNKPKKIGAEDQVYAARAKALAAIKTQQDLKAYLE